MEALSLSSGIEIPVLGFGTWESTGNDCRRAVKHALDTGYTHIDTAWAYKNHHDIGQALKEYGVDRTKLFITSKVWIKNLHYDQVIQQTEGILKDLMTDYLDLLLIHWPSKEVPLQETFSAFEKLMNAGKIRSFGVSNFTRKNLQKALSASDRPVAVNQVEYHPLLNQEDLLSFCRDNNVVVTAYSPLARGKVFENEILEKIAKEKDKSPAQISLRWLVQKGMVVIPKSIHPDHIESNFHIFDFSLSDEEMKAIDGIPEHRRQVSGQWLGIDLDE